MALSGAGTSRSAAKTEGEPGYTTWSRTSTATDRARVTRALPGWLLAATLALAGCTVLSSATGATRRPCPVRCPPGRRPRPASRTSHLGAFHRRLWRRLDRLPVIAWVNWPGTISGRSSERAGSTRRQRLQPARRCSAARRRHPDRGLVRVLPRQLRPPRGGRHLAGPVTPAVNSPSQT